MIQRARHYYMIPLVPCWRNEYLKQIAHAYLLLMDVCSSVMSWKVEQLKNWLVVTLTHPLKKCLAEYVLESKTFPHVLLHATFRLGNALSSSQNVYSVVPSRGSTTLLHFYTGPETPLLRPPLISGRGFLSRFLSSPFSRSSTPTDMLDEAILKELTDVGWFAPGFLTSPNWCIWCGVYSALINV